MVEGNSPSAACWRRVLDQGGVPFANGWRVCSRGTLEVLQGGSKSGALRKPATQPMTVTLGATATNVMGVESLRELTIQAPEEMTPAGLAAAQYIAALPERAEPTAVVEGEGVTVVNGTETAPMAPSST